MLTTPLLALTLLTTCVVAVPAEIEQSQNLGRRNLFERQSICGTTYCSSSETCCGYTCCAVGCDISGLFCSSTPSSCKATDDPCGSSCCNLLAGEYCDTSALTCVSSSDSSPAYTTPPTYYTTPISTPTPTPLSDSCYSYQTPCGSYCCSDSTETCSTNSLGTAVCVALDSNDDDSSHHHTSTQKSKSKKFPAKAIAGVVIGVLAALGLLLGAILYCCCGVGKKKKDSSSLPAGNSPYVYGSEAKQMEEPHVSQVAPEGR